MAKIYELMKQEGKTDRGSPLGLFSYLVMASIPHLKNEAFGLRITEFLIDELKTLIDPGQVYLTLKRLEARRPSLIRKEATRTGAHPSTLYSVTKEGEQALAKTERYIAVAARFSRGENGKARSKLAKFARVGRA